MPTSSRTILLDGKPGTALSGNDVSMTASSWSATCRSLPGRRQRARPLVLRGEAVLAHLPSAPALHLARSSSRRLRSSASARAANFARSPRRVARSARARPVRLQRGCRRPHGSSVRAGVEPPARLLGRAITEQQQELQGSSGFSPTAATKAFEGAGADRWSLRPPPSVSYSRERLISGSAHRGAEICPLG